MSIADKLTMIAENESKVYNAGYTQGFNNGYNAGADAEHKSFWDSYQNYGNRTNYVYAFSGEGWTKDNFKPIYDMKPTNAYGMFSRFGGSGNYCLNYLLQQLGVTLDLSKATSVHACFKESEFYSITNINTTSASDLGQLFGNCEFLDTVTLYLKNDGSQTFKRAFANCSKLTNLNIMSGVIGGTTFDVGYCPKLSKASIQSVMDAVSTTKATTITLSQTAVKAAFGSLTSTEWLNLRNTRPKCTVSLA